MALLEETPGPSGIDPIRIENNFRVRKRARNFTKEEIDIMLDIANKKRISHHARFSQKTSNASKKKLWSEIAEALNAVNGQNDRTGIEVRRKYSDVLNEARRKKRNMIAERRKTGGGSSKAEPLNDQEKAALECVAEVTVEGIDGGVSTNNTPEYSAPAERHASPEDESHTDRVPEMRSNRTVTRDIRKEEFKRLLDCHMETNNLLRELVELKKLKLQLKYGKQSD